MSKVDDITIVVTQEHIDKGKASPTNCPIALAYCSQLDPKCISVKSLISGTRWYILRKGKRIYRLPTVAAHFANAYDHGEPVTPFEFIAEGM